MSDSLEVMLGEVRGTVRAMREQQIENARRHDARHDALAADITAIKARLAGEDREKETADRQQTSAEHRRTRLHGTLQVFLSVLGGGLAGALGSHLWGK